MRGFEEEGEEPLIEKLLELGHGPQRLVLDVPAAAVRAAPGIAGRELAEQRAHRPEVALDMALLGSAAQVGGLDGDSQVPAGGPERGRDEPGPLLHPTGAPAHPRPAPRLP